MVFGLKGKLTRKALFLLKISGGQYWVRTSDPRFVKVNPPSLKISESF
jgi:hypothetical protein